MSSAHVGNSFAIYSCLLLFVCVYIRFCQSQNFTSFMLRFIKNLKAKINEIFKWTSINSSFFHNCDMTDWLTERKTVRERERKISNKLHCSWWMFVFDWCVCWFLPGKRLWFVAVVFVLFQWLFAASVYICSIRIEFLCVWFFLSGERCHLSMIHVIMMWCQCWPLAWSFRFHIMLAQIWW